MLCTHTHICIYMSYFSQHNCPKDFVDTRLKLCVFAVLALHPLSIYRRGGRNVRGKTLPSGQGYFQTPCLHQPSPIRSSSPACLSSCLPFAAVLFAVLCPLHPVRIACRSCSCALLPVEFASTVLQSRGEGETLSGRVARGCR